MIEQIPDFLPPSLAAEINETLLSDTFPWFFNNEITNGNIESLNSFQFTHNFYRFDHGWNSSWSPLVQAMLHIAELKLGVNPKNAYRIKANLLTLSFPEQDESFMHQDSLEYGFKSLLYYVEDSDGDTLIADELNKKVTQKITPKKNSAVFFDSNIWHSSSRPKMQKRRVVINSIFRA